MGGKDASPDTTSGAPTGTGTGTGTAGTGSSTGVQVQVQVLDGLSQGAQKTSQTMGGDR